MTCVVKVIFKIAYCYPSTRDICYKDGNSLLFAICSAYPQLIGPILSEIDSNLEKIGKKALYLCNELPFNKWISHIDCIWDMNFMQKCLLQTPTNSIMFCVAVSCIDNLNFRLNTRELSFGRVKRWELKNGTRFSPDEDFVDLSQLIQIKLTVVLFELHLRLTNYQYFNRTATESIVDARSISMEVKFEICSLVKYNIKRVTSQIFFIKQELGKHYSSLAKDKRFSLVNWIWLTINRMNLYLTLKSPIRLTETLDKLSNIYSPSSHSCQRVLNSHLNSLLTQISFGTSIESKCPLEKYLNLVLVCTTSTDLSSIFEKSTDIIHLILNTHNKKSKLQELSYSLIFNWFENLIFKYTTVKLRKSMASTNEGLTEGVAKINEFRSIKQTYHQKFSMLLLIILNPNASNAGAVIEAYCQRIIKRLDKFISIRFDETGVEKERLVY